MRPTRRVVAGTAIVAAIVLALAGVAVAAFTASTGNGPSALAATADCPSGLTLPPALDTWVGESLPDATHGDDSELWATSSIGASDARTLVRFPVVDEPVGCELLSATMSVPVDSTNLPDTLISVIARPAAQPWDESSTWNTRPSGHGSAAYGSLYYPDSGNPGLNIDFDVTTQIAAVLAGTAANDGFVISVADTGVHASIGLQSSDGNPTLSLPQLTLTFVAVP